MLDAQANVTEGNEMKIICLFALEKLSNQYLLKHRIKNTD
jgi:hypothetical protein